jgi:hypothetical protein
LPGRGAVVLVPVLVPVLVIPRHAFIVPATTDTFRTYDLHIRLSAVDA